MTVDVAGSEARTVRWQYVPPGAVEPAVARPVPYLECKLEHTSLEPTGYGDTFFPEAVPYELDGTARVFYWRPTLDGGTPPPEDWRLACATTTGFSAYTEFPAETPPLTTASRDGVTVIVDGTVAGEAATVRLASYRQPDVRIDGLRGDTVSLTVEGEGYAFDPGDRHRIQLGERRVEPPDEEGTTDAVTPEFVVRYPGRRELHHPALGTADRLFPSFGLDLATVPNPVSVPTTAGELDHEALAEELGVNVAERPYAERVLWRAFAHSAFDPHEKRMPRLTQLPTDEIVLAVSDGDS